MVIISVRQGYESMESQYDYKMEIEVTYRDKGALIDIRKLRYNFDIDGKLRYFNYNTYKHIVRDYQRLKREKETRKCYKYDKCDYSI